MKETAVRDLLRQTVGSDEPPIGAHILGGALRGARAARRRRLAVAITAAAAVIPALAFGVPAVAGALSPAAPVHHYGFPSLTGGSAAKPHATIKARVFPRHRTAPATTFTFVRPKRLTGSQDPNPVPITIQSLGQLLIDDLPAGAQSSQIEASVNVNPSATYRTADAWFNDVTTPVGSGTVQADMMVAGSQALDFGCPRSVTCHDYTLPGGVKVVEEYETGTVTATGQAFIQLNVDVFRPDEAELSIFESDGAMAAGSPITKAMPLTMHQMLKIALDSRWQFTISQAFAQAASGLHVAPLDTAGS
jgi:hypothetical protein